MDPLDFPFYGNDYGTAEFGTHKVTPKCLGRPALTRRNRRMLYRVLNHHTTVAFVGAGLSRSLGYPGWREFASELVDQTLNLLEIKHEDQEPAASLMRFKRELSNKSDEGLSSRQTIFVLGACKRLLLQSDCDNNTDRILNFNDYLHFRFCPEEWAVPEAYKGFQAQKAAASRETLSTNPYLALMELPILRFVTSNYDTEIEKALEISRKRRVPPDEFGLPHTLERTAGRKAGHMRSFTQELKYSENLALFAMGRIKDADNTVFHCHGRWDNPEGMVVSEADYQRWYLNDSPEGICFRQTIDLLFSSNPILFLGFGMEDDDLIRPLRMFVASHARSSSRPLFALLPYQASDPQGASGKSWDYFDLLYERYGVHVIPFEPPTEPRTWGEEWSAQISNLDEGRSNWRQGALQKPKVKAVKVRTETSRSKVPVYFSYRVKLQSNEGDARVGRINRQYDDFKEMVLRGKHQQAETPSEPGNRPRVVVVLGPGGAGKSCLASGLVDDLADRESGDAPFDGLFFWSSYYCDDSLTGLDHVLAFLEQMPSSPISAAASPEGSGTSAAGGGSFTGDSAPGRLEQLRSLLKGRRCLLVFDGIERLLRQGQATDEGYAYGWGVRQFLDVITDPNSQSTVILTTRLWPRELNRASSPPNVYTGRIRRSTYGRVDDIEFGQATSQLSRSATFSWGGPEAGAVLPTPKDGVYCFRIPRMRTEAVRQQTRLSRLDEASSLCALTHGHAYSVYLAETLLPGGSNDFPALRMSLTGTPSDRQPARLIREALDRMDQKTNGLVTALLERLAVFMTPVHATVIQACYRSAREDHPAFRRRKRQIRDEDEKKRRQQRNDLVEDETVDDVVKGIIRRLEKAKLLLRVTSNDMRFYTLHPVIRGYVFQQLHDAGTDLLPNLTLPGFTAGGAEVHPGTSRAAAQIRDMFNRLVTPAENILNEYEQQGLLLPQTESDIVLRHCRNAFGIVRSRMAANTVSRWTNYDEYVSFLLRTLRLARSLSKGHWDFAESADQLVYEDGSGPLYADELAWIYNEMGIACHSEGAILDALAVWEQGLAINHVIDRDDRLQPYVVQSLCNLGAANIECGNLPRAEQYLREGVDASFRLGDHDHVGRMMGYLGLIEHLRANLTEANDLYEQALERIGNENPRARSFFLFHQSNLLLKLRQLDSAEKAIGMSASLAAKARYPDLIAYARSAQGHLLRLKGNFSEALLEYESAMHAARKIGIRKLEADVLSELSRLALQLGDAEVATKRAIEALKIANELGLGLRQTHGLVVLGKATVKAGQMELGIAYLRHAKRLADQQEYRLRGAEAEEELHRLGKWQPGSASAEEKLAVPLVKSEN